MATRLLEHDLRERTNLGGEWHPHGKAETRLVDASRQVFVAARQLEQVSGMPRSAGATYVSLGSLHAAFESLANASLMIRQAAAAEFDAVANADDERDQLEQLARLLFSVDQNLRFAAHACQLGRDALASFPDPR